MNLIKALIEYFTRLQRIRKPKTNTPISNAHEAVEKLVQEKKISSKINYDVLKNLNKDLSKFILFLR